MMKHTALLISRKKLSYVVSIHLKLFLKAAICRTVIWKVW